MISSTYRTGSWLGIVRSGSVIVLESNTNPAIVNRLWDFLGQDPTIHGVLNAVTAEFGTGLTGLPHFAIVVQSDKLHAILRGDITLVAQLNGASEVVSGRDVSTWSERSLQLPESLVLTLADDAGDVLELPVDEAVVRLQGLEITISQGSPPGFSSAALNVAGSESASSVFAADGALTAGTHDGVAAAHDADWPASAGAAPGESGFAVVPADGFDLPAADAHATDESAADTTAADTTAADANAFDDTVAGTGSLDLAAPAETEEDWAPEAPAAVEPSEEFDGEATDGGEPLPGESADSAENHDWFAPAEDPATADADADAHVVDAGEEDAYAGFAMAAEAADAEWSAQLAPVEASGDDESNDLNLTIRPEDHDGEFAADHTVPEHALTDQTADDQTAAEQACADQAVAESSVAEQDLADTPEDNSADTPAEGGEAADFQDAAETSSADEESFTTNYDHLWGPTVARSVEDAAVRLDENGLPVVPLHGEAAHADPQLPPLPPLPPLAGSGQETPANGVPASQDSAPFAPEAQHTPGEAFTAPAAPAAGQGAVSLMIESVPWGNPAARAAAQSAEQPAAASDFDPDHDGQTIMSGQYQRDGSPAAVEPLESRPPTGPMVLARMCPHGHANPPSRSQCSDCGALINSEPREVGRPRLGTMHISSGESVELDHSLIIGRQPSVSRVMGGAMPRLVQVKSGNDDISRSHVEVRLDGWDVLLVDLKATNGTVLVREGQAPRRLSQGEEAILLNGDIAELGDGISLLFDGLL